MLSEKDIRFGTFSSIAARMVSKAFGVLLLRHALAPLWAAEWAFKCMRSAPKALVREYHRNDPSSTIDESCLMRYSIIEGSDIMLHMRLKVFNANIG